MFIYFFYKRKKIIVLHIYISPPVAAVKSLPSCSRPALSSTQRAEAKNNLEGKNIPMASVDVHSVLLVVIHYSRGMQHHSRGTIFAPGLTKHKTKHASSSHTGSSAHTSASHFSLGKCLWLMGKKFESNT